MSNKQFNDLTPAEHERLAILMEECSEVCQIIGKILRHGYESRHPNGGPTNRAELMEEIGHIYYIVEAMETEKDINFEMIVRHMDAKKLTIEKYLHHQG